MAAKFDDRSRLSASSARAADSATRHTAEVRATGADTLPPMSMKDLLSAGGASLFVLSTDAELIDTVQRAGGDRYSVGAVDRWDELEAAVVAGRCGVALLDADLLGESLRVRIAALDAYSNRLVTLVAADRPAAQGLMGLLSERKIHRLLIKPPALGITRLLIESALNRHLRLRELAEADGMAIEPPQRTPLARRSSRTPLWVLATAAAALLAGVALIAGVSAWWRSSPGESAPTALVTLQPAASQAAAPAVEPPEASARFAALFLEAERAFREGRLAEPPGANALDHYLAILAADPTDPTARAKLGVVVDALFAQAEAALLADDHAAAANTLAHVRRADPTSGRLAFLDTQLARATAAAAAAAAAPVVAVAVPAPVAVIAAEPTGATEQDVRAELAAELATELAAKARIALQASDIEAAVALVTEAQRLGADPEVLALLDAELATARAARAARAEQLELRRLEQQYLAEAVPASELALLERGTPVYPDEAIRRGIEGWVDVEFVVDVAGRPQDIAVTAAEPVGRFEEAALAALREYRYAPFEERGRVFARRVRLRMRFELQ
jgi:TonB family protein